MLLTGFSRKLQRSGDAARRLTAAPTCALSLLQEYIDGPAGGRGRSEASETRAHVDGMLQEVRSSYRLREQQLAHAARSYKKRLQTLAKAHEALLVAYG